MEGYRPPLKTIINLELDQLRQDATFITLYSLRKTGMSPEAMQTGLSLTNNTVWTRRR